MPFKELAESMPVLATGENVDALLDTCFVVHQCRHNPDGLLKFCKEHTVGLTSFNLEELQYIARKLSDHQRKNIRRFFKLHPVIKLVIIPVHPGNYRKEQDYIREIDPDLLYQEEDASDGVLIAAGIKYKADIYTKDKHHIYTAYLEECVKPFGIAIYNNFPHDK